MISLRLLPTLFEDRLTDEQVEKLVNTPDYKEMKSLLSISNNSKNKYLLYLFAAANNDFEVLKWLVANDPEPQFSYTWGVCPRKYGAAVLEYKWGHCSCGITYWALKNGNKKMLNWVLEKGFAYDECFSALVAERADVTLLRDIQKRGFPIYKHIGEVALETGSVAMFEWVYENKRLPQPQEVMQLIVHGSLAQLKRFDELDGDQAYTYAPLIYTAQEAGKTDIMDYLIAKAERKHGKEFADELRVSFRRP